MSVTGGSCRLLARTSPSSLKILKNFVFLAWAVGPRKFDVEGADKVDCSLRKRFCLRLSRCCSSTNYSASIPKEQAALTGLLKQPDRVVKTA